MTGDNPRFPFTSPVNMLKYTILLAAFTAFVNCSSEMKFGIMTIRYILNYYNDQMVALQPLFDENIHKYLADLETRALAVSDALATCVHEDIAPIEGKLVEEVKEALDQESNRIMETMATVENLSADEVDKLWTSVSQDGTFRNEMNKMIMELKTGMLQKLEEFKVKIAAKCAPIAAATPTQVNRRTGMKLN